MFRVDRMIKRAAVLGLWSCLACAATASAKEAQTELQTEQESETEAAAKELPEDGILYFDLEKEEAGALRLTEKDEVVRIAYDEEDAGKEKETEVKLLDEPCTYYATTALYMRAVPETDARIVQILEIEQEITVYAEIDEWYLAGTDRGFGFVASKYLTDNEEEAAKSAKAEEAARAAEAAAAAAAAQNAAQQAPSAPSGKYEVSRENVPSCEDGSHGTTYITYSDGSVEAVDY